MAEPITIPQRSHSYKKVDAKAPTCTENGHKEGKVCSMCGVPQNAEDVIPKLGHSYSNDSDATCNTCGEAREVEQGGENTPTPKESGDINGDGNINAKDALEALKSAVGKVKLNDAQKAAADVNGDGNVNAKDALEILKFAVGKPSVLATAR